MQGMGCCRADVGGWAEMQPARLAMLWALGWEPGQAKASSVCLPSSRKDRSCYLTFDFPKLHLAFCHILQTHHLCLCVSVLQLGIGFKFIARHAVVVDECMILDLDGLCVIVISAF